MAARPASLRAPDGRGCSAGAARRGAGALRPALAAALLVGALLALALTSGCGKRKNVLVGNLPPETTLFVQDDTISTVSHRVHIYWFGTDPDGEVVRFEFRFLQPGGPPDPLWISLSCPRAEHCNDSLFTVFTGDSAVISRQFQVRAVDNRGTPDPTPATQLFTLSNLLPKVRITNPYTSRDTTFASAAISWELDDPDGGGPGLSFRVYLNGHEADYDSTTELSYTVPTARFLQGGLLRSGFRTLYVQALDDGGRLGPPDSTRWYVRAPAQVLRNNRGRLLLIDDSGVNSVNNFSVDTLFANTLARDSIGTAETIALPRGSFSILKLNSGSPFRSATDFSQTLRLFEAVAWYRGYDVSFSVPLQTYQDSLGAYMENGGRLLLEGTYLIQGLHTHGSLREDFVTRYLDCVGLYEQFNPNLNDLSAGLGNNTGVSGKLRSSLYGGILARFADFAPVVVAEGPGLRGFVPIDTSEVALWAMPGTLNPANTDEVPVAMTVPRAGGGRVTIVTLPVRILGVAAGFNRSWQVLAKLLFDRTSGVILP